MGDRGWMNVMTSTVEGAPSKHVLKRTMKLYHLSSTTDINSIEGLRVRYDWCSPITAKPVLVSTFALFLDLEYFVQ